MFKDWLKDWFYPRTVDTIIAPITRIVDDLHAHAGKHEAKADQHIALVDHHHERAAEAQAEARKAVEAAGKIASLVR